MMLASRRRTSAKHAMPPRRARAGLAAAAALTLGLAACGDGGDDADDGEELEAPADDGAVDGTAEDGAEDGTEDGAASDGEAAPEEAPSFDSLEDGEVVPGVRLEAPVDEATSQAQPTPTGSAFVAALPDEAGAVTVNVQFDGQPLSELLAGIDAIVESGQAEMVTEAEDIEVDGSDEASRVQLSAPEGGALATGVFATADGNAISVAIEVVEGADVDIEPIIESLAIDPDRLQAEGTLELEQPPAGDTGDGADGAVEPDPEG